MALISIVLRDVDDRIDMTMESEPSFDLTDGGELSPAQVTALMMLNAAADSADGDVEVKASK